MKTTLEIRAAEGGEDSKLFVQDLAKAYIKMFGRLGWKHRLLTLQGGLVIEVEGKDVERLKAESGGHRIQRVPPTERQGRVHSSTVTVAVLEKSDSKDVPECDSDLRVEWYSGTGAGGQHRNKHQNSCRITHIPTGFVSTSQCRSRENSFNEARRAILDKVGQVSRQSQKREVDKVRKDQVGLGERGDKIRTYRFQDGIVKDHRTEKSATITKVLSGYFDLLWV